VVNGQPAADCYEQSTASWVVSQANRLSDDVVRSLSDYLEPVGLSDLLRRKGRTTIAVLGGEVDCTMHRYALVAMPRANPELEFIVSKNLSDDRLFVSIYRDAQLVPVSFETWVDGARVRQNYGRTGIEVTVASTGPLAYPPVTHFTAGKTRHEIIAKPLSGGGWEVHILPNRRIALFDDSVCAQTSDTLVVETASAEDCPPPLDSSPNALPEGASIKVAKLTLPSTLDRLFVSSPEGLASAEILARGAAICLSLLIVLAVPGATIWRSNGSILRAVFLTLAGGLVLLLALAPDLVAIARLFIESSRCGALAVLRNGGLVGVRDHRGDPRSLRRRRPVSAVAGADRDHRHRFDLDVQHERRRSQFRLGAVLHQAQARGAGYPAAVCHGADHRVPDRAQAQDRQ
jgi:hypothetical protein